MKNDEDVSIYEKTLKENPLYPVEECYIQTEKLIDNSITSLYDSIGNYIFQDTTVQRNFLRHDLN